MDNIPVAADPSEWMSMRRTDLMDTSEWAHHEMVRRLRRMTPSQRIQLVLEHIEFGRKMKVAQAERMKKKLCR